MKIFDGIIGIQTGGGTLKVGINIDHSVKELEVLITAQEQSGAVNALYEHIVDFDRKSLETLTAYKDDIAKIVYVTDIFRIYTGNQKVYIQTLQGEYAIRYRLYELEEALDKKWLTNVLQSRKNFYRRNRDLCIICMVGVYLVAMVDAYVDASLSHFDISPDLSMDVSPAMFIDGRNTRPSIGLVWAFTF